jgi:uncharacterized protein YecE (DUF72 family)
LLLILIPLTLSAFLQLIRDIHKWLAKQGDSDKELHDGLYGPESFETWKKYQEVLRKERSERLDLQLVQFGAEQRRQADEIKRLHDNASEHMTIIQNRIGAMEVKQAEIARDQTGMQAKIKAIFAILDRRKLIRGGVGGA